MPQQFTLHFLMPLALGAISLGFIGLGLYALIRKRPFIISARWMLALLALALSPSAFMQLSTLFSPTPHLGGTLGMLPVIGLATTIIVLCFVGLQMRGYIAFGTTQDSFHDALVSALSNLHLEFEEKLSSIRIPSVPAELQVAVHDWIGTAQLRLRGGGRPELLAAISRGMNAYFNSGRVKMNVTTAVAYVILGALMGAMVVVLMLTLTGLPLRPV